MTYPIHTIAEHDTTFLQPVYEGGSTYHWYSISAANEPNHEIQPRFANVDNAKNYILNTLKGIPNRVGEAVNIAYYTAILDGNALAASQAIIDAQTAELLKTQSQVEAKINYLQSSTAQWNDINTYNTAVASTNEALTEYNKSVTLLQNSARTQQPSVSLPTLPPPSQQLNINTQTVIIIAIILIIIFTVLMR